MYLHCSCVHDTGNFAMQGNTLCSFLIAYVERNFPVSTLNFWLIDCLMTYYWYFVFRCVPFLHLIGSFFFFFSDPETFSAVAQGVAKGVSKHSPFVILVVPEEKEFDAMIQHVTKEGMQIIYHSDGKDIVCECIYFSWPLSCCVCPYHFYINGKETKIWKYLRKMLICLEKNQLVSMHIFCILPALCWFPIPCFCSRQKTKMWTVEMIMLLVLWKTLVWHIWLRVSVPLKSRRTLCVFSLGCWGVISFIFWVIWSWNNNRDLHCLR